MISVGDLAWRQALMARQTHTKVRSPARASKFLTARPAGRPPMRVALRIAPLWPRMAAAVHAQHDCQH